VAAESKTPANTRAHFIMVSKFTSVLAPACEHLKEILNVLCQAKLNT